MSIGTAASLTIRHLLPDDLPAYKALRDAMLEAHPVAFSSDAATERGRTAESYRARLGLEDRAGAVFTLGAWQSEATSGSGSGSGSESRAESRGASAFARSALVGAISCEHDARAKVRHIGHVTGMMVQSRVQGLGIGRALLIEAIARARAADGLTMLTLSVTADNLPALQLYAGAGFTRFARLPHAVCVDGSYYTKDQMVLSL